VLRSKVTIDDLAGGRIALGVAGADAGDRLTSAGLPVPAEPRAVALAASGVQVVRTLGAAARFLAIGAPDTLPSPPEADGTAWRGGDIDAGLPVVFPETQDRWVAQMVNLDRFGAIGFEKGCYTGQEVVARLHYLGNLKKRMFRLTGEGPCPARGADIQVAGEGQAVGEIVDSVPSGGGFVASAVLQIAQAPSDALTVGSARCRVPTEYAY
jgi:folate-binding protein YgfZ